MGHSLLLETFDYCSDIFLRFFDRIEEYFVDFNNKRSGKVKIEIVSRENKHFVLLSVIV